MNYKHLIYTLFLCTISACVLDSGGSKKNQDCSVSARCSGQPDLGIRLRQVETYYFESDEDSESAFADIAQFDYNTQQQWSGGTTRRAAEANFDYIVEYDNDGKMSRTERIYFADDGNFAEVVIDYSYSSGQLSQSVINTEIRTENNALIKTIEERVHYQFQDGVIQKIEFDIDDSSNLGNSTFDYEFVLTSTLIKEILLTNQSSGKPDFVFKSFTYKDGKVSESKTFKLNAGNQQTEHESITYIYYLDGPLKQKISILSTEPKQKIITSYKWEAGACATNQTFGDRLFPTPEVPNFPCL